MKSTPLAVAALVLAASIVLSPRAVPAQEVPSSALAPSDVESGYFRVGPDSLFYEVAGEGPALVLIHDGVVHREVWENQFPVFSREFRVVRYDRRGYGESPPASVAYSDLEDLTALMEHLGIRVGTLMGMSSGGRLAMDFTLGHPERVHALVLVGAVVRGLPYTQHFYTRGGHLPEGLDETEVLAYYAAQDPYEVYRENRAASERLQELAPRGYRLAERRFHGSFSGPVALEHLGEIRVPTLILVGEFDIPDVHAHAGAINAGIPGSRRDIIPRAGHIIPLEQPELFNQVVLEFLHEGQAPGAPLAGPPSGAPPATR